MSLDPIEHHLNSQERSRYLLEYNVQIQDEMDCTDEKVGIVHVRGFN